MAIYEKEFLAEMVGGPVDGRQVWLSPGVTEYRLGQLPDPIDFLTAKIPDKFVPPREIITTYRLRRDREGKPVQLKNGNYCFDLVDRIERK